MLSKLLLFLDQTGLLHSGCDTRHKASVFAGLGKRCSDLCLTTRSAGGGGPSIPFVASPGPKGCEVRLCGLRGEGPARGSGRGWNSAAMCVGLTMQNGLGQKEATVIQGENTFPGQKPIKTWQGRSKGPLRRMQPHLSPAGPQQGRDPAGGTNVSPVTGHLARMPTLPPTFREPGLRARRHPARQLLPGTLPVGQAPLPSGTPLSTGNY